MTSASPSTNGHFRLRPIARLGPAGTPRSGRVPWRETLPSRGVRAAPPARTRPPSWARRFTVSWHLRRREQAPESRRRRHAEPWTSSFAEQESAVEEPFAAHFLPLSLSIPDYEGALPASCRCGGSARPSPLELHGPFGRALFTIAETLRS